MIHLRSLSIDRESADAGFPFSIPAVATLPELQFDAPVTLFVGENGSGKSTLLEALAWATESITAGSESIDIDKTLAHVRPLGKAMRLTWHKRTRRGFFLRAEDFFSYVKGVRTAVAKFTEEADALALANPDMHEPDLRRMQAPSKGSAMAMTQRYGADMDARSHGEQFISFFQARLVSRGLYLLDEPEAPLSPSRQLALLTLLLDAVNEGESQFVIATHSPILMAFPNARIFDFDTQPVRAVAYDELEHVTFTRDFLNDPEAFLRHL